MMLAFAFWFLLAGIFCLIIRYQTSDFTNTVLLFTGIMLIIFSLVAFYMNSGGSLPFLNAAN